MTHNVTEHVGDGDYAWMPDGRSFVFVRKARKQKPQLYRYTLGTGAIVQLTHIKQGVSSPVVSHAGDRIALAVTDTRPGARRIRRFRARPASRRRTRQKKSDIDVIDQLFFEANGQGYTYRDHQHIWIVDADGSHPKQLTSGKYSEGFDAWSPDDRTILVDSLRYESVDSGPNDVYTMPSTRGRDGEGRLAAARKLRVLLRQRRQPRLLFERRRERFGGAAGARFGERATGRTATSSSRTTPFRGAIRCWPT